VHEAELWLPHFHTRRLGSWTYRARLHRARRRLQRLGCRRIVLYVWRPEFADAVKLVPHDFCCYHIDDEYSFTDHDVPNSPIELDLIRSADHVIVHSRTLLAKKGGINPRTSLIPNGVAFDAFARPAVEPPDLASIPRPRIGYVGYLKRQLDWPLMQALADRHPAWSFVLVGPIAPHPDLRPELDALARRPNVHFLGAKDVATLAAYPQHFDVCTMPYRLTADGHYIFPLKLHEYLASGRPTVGTPIASLLDFADVVTIARTVDEWSAGIQALLDPAASAPGAVERRRAVARAYDWNVLVQRIAEIMLPGLSHSRKNGSPG
jgi:glycosyltransferase involved in cell wall biosynthesis